GRLKLYSVTAFAALIGALYAPCASAAEQAVAVINRGVVEIETSGSAGISVRIAEDLANLVDDGATRRVVPVVGKGSLQSLTDLKYLRGSGTSITAGRLFEMLNIPVTLTNDSQEVALDKLRRGEIAALAFVAGK